MSTATVSPPAPPAPPTPTTPRAKRQPVTVKPFVSLLGALSVLSGGAALVTTVSGASWVGPSVQIVGLVWLIGLGCRLLRLPAPVTVLAQAAGIIVTLTAVFTTEGYGGLIPNAAAGREAEALLTGAWEQIVHSTVPAPATEQLSFLIAVCLGLVALIVDFFVSEVDAPALVALPLLCLYSIPASIAASLLPWWSFALPAGCYAALVVVAGHPGRRVGLRAGVGVAIAGGLAVVVAIGGSLLVADSITEVGTAGRIDRGNEPLDGSDVGLSPFASLHGDLVRAASRDVLQISDLPSPDYLRTTALESWSADQGFSLADPEQGARPAGSPIAIDPLTNNDGVVPATVQVKVLSFADQFVPLYPGTSNIAGLAGDYSYNSELGSVFKSESTVPNNYELTANFGTIDPAVLRADTVSPNSVLTSAEGVPVAAVELARTITQGAQTPFDAAVLLKDYFTNGKNGFSYSLSVPEGNTGNLLTDFLENKQGYCEQYAAAMAVMLRSLGIPARVAIGFTQGTQQSPGTYVITSHDAHAWVEVLFDSAGWVRFDPTPLSSAGGLQGYQTSDAAAPSDDATTDSDTAAASVDPSSAGQTTAGSTVTDFETVLVDGDQAGGSGGIWKPWLGWTLAALVVLGVLAYAPTLWRRRRTAGRLALIQAGGPTAPAAAWAEVEDLAVDHGLPSGRGATVRKAANQLAREGKLGEVARAGLRRIALGTESSWYSPAGYASELGVDLAEDVRRIAVDLEHAAPRTLRSRLVPRSLVNRD